MTAVLLCFLILGYQLSLCGTHSHSTTGRLRLATLGQSRDYLHRYGYLTSRFPRISRSIHDAIAEFQRRAHLSVTGSLNSETLGMISRKRCGVPDIMRTSVTSSRVKRYVLSETRWHYTDLTYCVKSYPLSPDITHWGVDRVLAKAFKVWEEVSALTFTQEKHCNVDIVIMFSSRYHGDTTPFDGPGNILAHAYFPGDNRRGLHGDLHFDDDEPWATDRNVPDREDIFCVAVHELGHSLGLQHSEVKGAIMSPWARTCSDNPLTWDDIRGIQRLYGPPHRRRRSTTAVTTITPSLPRSSSPAVTSDPDMCDGRVDSVTVAADGKTYGFKGHFVYLFERPGVAPGYPRFISDVFPQAPHFIDSSITLVRKTPQGIWELFTYLFKGDVAYIYQYNNDRFQLYKGPVSFSVDLNLPDLSRLDASFYIHDINVIYFTRGQDYWKLIFNSEGRIRVNKARRLSSLRVLRGIPAFRTAVRIPNGQVHFFQDTTFYRLEGKGPTRRLAGPLETANWWFDCKDGP